MVRSVMVRALHPLTFRCLRGAAMSAMHEDVHQRTQEEDQEGPPAEQMRSVFEDEKEAGRSEGHTSELQSLMRTSYAVFCLQPKNNNHRTMHRLSYSICTQTQG